MTEDRAAETPSVQLASLRTDIRNIKERGDEDREKQDRIYDLVLDISGRTKNIERDLSLGNDRFRTIESDIADLKSWRASHSGAKNALAGLWGAVIAIIGAVGIYFATFFHPGGK
ncbi:MAG: hypothetical protein WDN29_16470 [Methylovirgula sp.]